MSRHHTADGQRDLRKTRYRVTQAMGVAGAVVVAGCTGSNRVATNEAEVDSGGDDTSSDGSDIASQSSDSLKMTDRTFVTSTSCCW